MTSDASERQPSERANGHGVPLPAARRRERRLRRDRRRDGASRTRDARASSTSRRSWPTTVSACRSSCSRRVPRTTRGATTRVTGRRSSAGAPTGTPSTGSRCASSSTNAGSAHRDGSDRTPRPRAARDAGRARGRRRRVLPRPPRLRRRSRSHRCSRRAAGAGTRRRRAGAPRCRCRLPAREEGAPRRSWSTGSTTWRRASNEPASRRAGKTISPACGTAMSTTRSAIASS